MTYSNDQMMAALKTPPSPSTRRLYKRAWTTALLGFVLLVLSFALSFYWRVRWAIAVYGDHVSEELSDLFHSLSWLNSVAVVADMIGMVLVVSSIVFVIRGLLVDNDRWRARTILVGTLKRLKLIALIALMFYLFYVPISILMQLVFGGAYWLALSFNPAFLFLAALPLVLAHALNKPSV